jgi:hypothetical protein
MKPIREKLADVMFDGIPKIIDKFGYMDIGTLALVRKPELSISFPEPHRIAGNLHAHINC